MTGRVHPAGDDGLPVADGPFPKREGLRCRLRAAATALPHRGAMLAWAAGAAAVRRDRRRNEVSAMLHRPNARRRPAFPGVGPVACAAAVLPVLFVLGACSPKNRPEPDGRGRNPNGIRLVLQVTIDQLRADLLMQARDRWGEGGFRRLYDAGVVFENAHHGHANTETVVGHATLATGADPAVHGMIGNAWFDRGTDTLRTNVSDPRFPTIGDPSAVRDDELHAGPATSARGCSPEALLAPTIADSIAAAGHGRAKVFAVSLKDRGAVPMAGRSGKAFWWSTASGRFVSSTYYYPGGRLPGWVRDWNRDRFADRFDGRSWTLLLDPSTYAAIGRDDEPWEEPPPGLGRTFPHTLHRRGLGEGYYDAVAASPFGDEVLLDFAEEVLEEQDLGRDDVTDYLSVSFSSPDYIGHRFGPSSLETEDEILRIDRVLARLLEEADEAAGAGRTVVVLSSDHGVGEVPACLQAQGKEGGRIVLSDLMSGPGFAKIRAKYGTGLVRRYWPPYVYLDRENLRSRALDAETVARDLAAAFAGAPGIAAAFTRRQIETGPLPDTPEAAAVRRSFHPDRSGDIHVVVRPGWQLAYEGESPRRYATGHGTPWDYDTHVPLLFAGPRVRHAVVERRVAVVDVAPTLAALVGVEAPSRATGEVLPEVLP